MSRPPAIVLSAAEGVDRFPSRRLVNTLGFVVCGGLLAYGYYLQFFQGLEPCPLCLLQRFGFMGLGLMFVLAALHDPRGWGSRVYGGLQALAAIAGGTVSVRQVWLQSLTEAEKMNLPTCPPSFEYMVENFPLLETFRVLFSGSGDCAKVDWTFLGLSIAGWALAMFVALGLAGLIRNWKVG